MYVNTNCHWGKEGFFAFLPSHLQDSYLMKKGQALLKPVYHSKYTN